MKTSIWKKENSSALSMVLCILVGALYLAFFGVGAEASADTGSYVDFVAMRPLGYPIVLWVLQNIGLMPYLGLLQLALMFAGYQVLWRAARTYFPEGLAWLMLGLCLVNIELVKYAFRELPEAIFVAALTWHLSALLHIIAGKKLGALFMLVISGAALMWIRPTGLPILLASALALIAYVTPIVALRAIVGCVVLGWLAPTLANGLSRGIYEPQLYSGFHAVVTVSHAVMLSDPNQLSAPLDGLASNLASLGAVYGEPAWPFERATMEALVSPYLTAKLASEFQVGDYGTFANVHEASERGRAYFGAALMTLPGNYIAGVSANMIGLLAGPGFLAPSSKAAISERLSAVAPIDPMLANLTQEALDAQRVIPAWVLALARIFGVIFLVISLLAGFRLAIDLALKFMGRATKFGNGIVVASLGTMISGYILMAGLVAPITRFTLAIYPLLALFLIAILALSIDKFRIARR